MHSPKSHKVQVTDPCSKVTTYGVWSVTLVISHTHIYTRVMLLLKLFSHRSHLTTIKIIRYKFHKT